MTTENKNGYEFISIVKPFAVANAIKITSFDDKLVDYINENGIEQIYIPAQLDLQFLLGCPRIRYLVTRIENNLTPLYEMSDLLMLGLIGSAGESKMVGDFYIDRLRKLECFGSPYHKSLKNLGGAKGLKSLALSGYRSEKKDLAEFSELSNLDTIRLIQGSITSLSGIESLPLLQCLYLDYISSLHDICALCGLSQTLKLLRIVKCSGIDNYMSLRSLNSLMLLELSNNNSIENVDFLDSMKELNTFICSMNILDGDLSRCLKLSWVHIIPNRKHYTHRDDDFMKIPTLRGNENIDEWRQLE